MLTKKELNAQSMDELTKLYQANGFQLGKGITKKVMVETLFSYNQSTQKEEEKVEMEKEMRIVKFEEYHAEERRCLEHSVQDDKVYMGKKIDELIEDLQKIRADLAQYVDNPYYLVPTDIDNTPRLGDFDKLNMYANRINQRVGKLILLEEARKAFDGEIKVEVEKPKPVHKVKVVKEERNGKIIHKVSVKKVEPNKKITRRELKEKSIVVLKDELVANGVSVKSGMTKPQVVDALLVIYNK